MTSPFTRWLFPTLLLMVAPAAPAATIYLCKSYSGGTFWSSATCSQQQATIDRMVSVPDGMPFDQQVHLGEQAREAGRRLVEPASTSRTTTLQTSNTAGKTVECEALAGQIQGLEAMSRQPHSGSQQDWITAEKRKARDQQFRLRC